MSVGNVSLVDTMKKQLLITLVGALMLISLAQLGVITTTAADQQQKCQLKAESINERNAILSSTTTGAKVAGGNNHISLFKADSTLIPSEMVLQMNISSVHVGDAFVGTGKLIDNSTGKGIPGATVTIQISVDGNNWTPAGSVKTDNNGSVTYQLTVPDPRSFGYTLPLKIYCKLSYDGGPTYAPTSKIFSVMLLAPASTTATAPGVTLAPQAFSYH